MKKLLTILMLLMILVLAAGCSQGETPAGTEPEITESAEDAQTLKILMIGDSSGNDAMWLAYDVFKAEQPDRNVVIGNLYYSSCTMQSHANHAKEDAPDYTYYRNDMGRWEMKENYAISYALEEEHWDVVIIQETNHLAGIEKYYKTDDIPTLTKHIVDVLGYTPHILWNMLWVNPVGFDEWIFTDPANPAPANVPGWKSNYAVNYENSIDKMYECVQNCVNTYVIGKENGVTGLLTPATAIQHALKQQNIHEKELFRDYTHLSDYGRVMVAYNLYAQVCQLIDDTAPELTEIKLTTVPSYMRQKRFASLGDLVLTEDQQKSIAEAVNYAVKDPGK